MPIYYLEGKKNKKGRNMNKECTGIYIDASGDVNDQLVVYVTYQDNSYEVLDRADSLAEAAYLAEEYRLAFKM